VRHPLVDVVAEALPHARAAEAARYLDLLGRRLRWIQARADGHPRAAARLAATPEERALARRFLRRVEGTWDDADENLVRGYLDRFERRGEDPGRAAAQSVLAAAQELSRIIARPGTLYFFLWELESMLTTPGEIARIPAPRKGRSTGGR
jgi:hypothetical protein